MAQTFGIPSTSLAKIQRMLNAKRAAGLTVQPWELESAFKAEMDSISDKQTSNRSLGIQEASLAETKRMNDVNTRLREDEARLREEEIATGKKASTLGAVGNIGTTVLMGKALGLWGKDTPAEKITEAATKGGTGASLQGAPETGLPFKTVMKNTVTRETFPESPEASYSEGVDAPGVSGQSLVDTTAPPVESTGTQLAPAAEVPTTTTTTPGITWGKGIGSGAAGLAAGKIIKDTGVGEWISNKAPFGGTREWNTATGAGVGAGIGYAIGGPWGAAIGAVTGGAGGGGLLDNWF